MEEAARPADCAAAVAFFPVTDATSSAAWFPPPGWW